VHSDKPARPSVDETDEGFDAPSDVTSEALRAADLAKRATAQPRPAQGASDSSTIE
jgi:hypothetical protein